MSESDSSNPDLRDLVASFGGYRAEQLEDQGRLYQLFLAPAFLAELETNRCCLLIGGRGTGKTTLLKGLSLEGQRHRLAKDDSKLSSIGVYLRINSNRVAAFTGPELKQDRWNRVFGHYLNLLLVDELLRTLLALSEARSTEAISREGLGLVCTALHLEHCSDLPTLRESVRRALIELEAAINNIGDGWDVDLSLQGQPIDLLVEYLRVGPLLRDRLLFFLVDEYENLSESQQAVFNTLIKHAKLGYSFKIGVKSLGLKTRSTLVASETLSSPADYEQIDIVSKLEAEGFPQFASRVVQLRLDGLSRQSSASRGSIPPPNVWLATLTLEEEAIKLGLESQLAIMTETLKSQLGQHKYNLFIDLALLDQYAVFYLDARDPVAAAERAIADPAAWRQRVDNHRYAMLFSIRQRRVGYRKYYAGWSTLCSLAAGNTRYLLQIVNEIAQAQTLSGNALEDEVSPEIQTRSAREVGYRNLTDLQGIAKDGTSLVRLLLGLGRVFNIMAVRPEGHAPEVNQFAVTETSDDRMLERTGALLDSGIQHQALVNFAGNKLARESGETRSSNFMLHPIYSPFFVYSHRKQRKMRISPEELNGLVDKPAQTIRAILAKTGREGHLDTSEFESQLSLFASFYEPSDTA